MLEAVNQILNGMFLPLLLLATGIFYMFRLGFFPVVKLPVIVEVLTRGKIKNGVSSFRSLTLALAGTLGVGNIVGVASAIAMGGAGAVFWMWLSAFAAMLLKYAEVVLGLRYRYRRDETWHGGAPYYIKQGLQNRGYKRLGVFLSFIFAILCILDSFTTGCSIQSAAISDALDGVMGIPTYITGLVLAVICTALLIRGTGMIMKVTGILVPVMCGGFLFLSFICMAKRPSEILPSLGLIFQDAFAPKSAVGGVGGFVFSRALRFGTMRGLLSNEAGCGTSPFAHAAADTNCPTEQGFFGIFEVFVDTILLCTVTAIVIVMNIDSVSDFGGNPMMLAIRAYSCSFEGILPICIEVFLGVSIFCFGFATLLCWAHYGLECVAFLSKGKNGQRFYMILFAITIYFGATAAQSFLWNIADLTIGLMILLHVPFLCGFSDEVLRETENYFAFSKQKIKKQKKFTKSS